MAQPEKLIVNKIKKALQERGAWVTKTHGSPHLAGLPDIIACYRGRFVGLEVKTPETRKNVSARQAAILKQIYAAGGWDGVVCSVDAALNILDIIDLDRS